MYHPHSRWQSLAALFLLAALLLSACGGTIETDLSLYSGDRFDARSRITVPAAALAMMGPDAIESQFRELERQAQAENSKFTWRKEKSKSPDEVVYSISAGGAGYEGLAGAYNVKVQKIKYQGQDALSISASPNYDLSGVQNVLRLHVGKILQTNNMREGPSTIVWRGTDTLQAIVTPKGSANWLVILLVLLAVSAAAGAAYVVLHRRPSRQVVVSAVASSVARTGGFCPFCGQPATPGAKFCMSCGQAFPPLQG